MKLSTMWPVSALTLALGAAVIAGGCARDDQGEAVGEAAEAQILDAAHGSQIPGFWFLEPFVDLNASPTFHTFATNANPTVTVDQVTASGAVVQANVATFTTHGGPRYRNADGHFVTEYVRLHPAGTNTTHNDDDDGDTDPNAYWYVRIDSDEVNFVDGNYYRVRVTVPGWGGAPRELGFADIQVVKSQKQAKRVDQQQFVPLIHDHGVRVKFRIDDDAIHQCLTETFEQFVLPACQPLADTLPVFGGHAVLSTLPVGVSQSAVPLDEGCEIVLGLCSTLNIDTTHPVLVARSEVGSFTFKFDTMITSFTAPSLYCQTQVPNTITVVLSRAGVPVLTDVIDRSLPGGEEGCRMGSSGTWTLPGGFDEIKFSALFPTMGGGLVACQ